MKAISINRRIFIALFSMFFLSGVVFSHTPSDIEVEMDIESGKVDIRVRHPSVDRRDDYIRKIEVYVDDVLFCQHQYSYQKDEYRNETVYISNLKDALKVRVVAKSKDGGSLEKSFDVPRPEKGKDL